MSDFIEDFLAYTDGIASPERFRLWAAISAVAGACERRLWLETTVGILYANLFVLLVAPPAVGKSLALSPVRKLWRDSKDFHVAPNSVTKAGLLDELAKAKTTKLINGGRDLFEYNCMLIASSEFGVLVPAHDTEFLSVLIDLYDNPSEFRESRRDKTRCVDIINPMLNIIAGTQPGFLAGMLPEEAWSMGFMSRNIMIYAGSGPKLDLFNFDSRDNSKWPAMLKQLEEIKALIGRMEFTPEYTEAVQAWLNAGQQPVPEHSKLQHYNGRRLLNALKLSIISAISARKELVLKLSDWERALGWLLEAEVHMPDVFREMQNRSDGAIIQELHFYMWKWYMSHKKEPMHENMLVSFLSNRVPSEKILKIIEISCRSDIIKQLEGTKLFIPLAKTQHGGE